MTAVDDAIARLRALLAAGRSADGGWPYYAGRRSRIEPTSWALIALGDHGAAGVLHGWRAASGLIVEPGMPGANYTFNGLAALALASTPQGAADAGTVARALLAHRGVKLASNPAFRQNSELQGWSWTDGTFSWVEPTSWCVLAVKKLARQAPEAAARIDEAERVLRDRVCVSGGWNYGNPSVFEKDLPAHVPPTAAGVLALQDRASEPMVQQAAGFLGREGGREGSTSALALSWLALSSVKAPAESFAAQLVDRLPMAESIANMASAAQMLYVLEQHARQAPPKALML